MSTSEDEQRPSRRDSPSGLRLLTVEQKVDNLSLSHRELVKRDDERHTDNRQEMKDIRADNKLEFADLRALIKEVLAQTTMTNGRVNSLEAWKDKVTGMWLAVTVMAAAGGAAFGVLGYCMNLILEHFKKP